MKGLVIGFGNMGLTHCERYAAMGVEVAVVDIDPAGRENARARGLRVYGSLDEMTPDSVGFFDICSPTHLHYAQIRAVGLHGKPIFVEKPLVRTPEELAALRRDPPNAPLFVGEVEHYNPSLASFLSYSGQPYSVQVRREVDLDFFTLGTTPWFLNETLSGGIVLDLMIHDLNLLVSKFGRPRVCAVTGRRVRHPCVDEVHAQLAFPDFGATVFSTWAATPGSSPVRATLR
ncbi:MAG TPA: Gfo/Idh/MocA family oxidoreductase, partial [Myxococcaceae bacterium]|nr:Gfo/Idh/MocA family oxidoreductase [Myxococcaceae bacterium]